MNGFQLQDDLQDLELTGVGQQQRVEAVAAQIGGEQATQFCIVVDEEDLSHGFGQLGDGDHSMPPAASG